MTAEIHPFLPDDHPEADAPPVDLHGERSVYLDAYLAPFAEWLALGARLVRPGGKVLGMEGLEQVALGPDDTRHAYDAGDRQRAIIVRRVPG